MKVIFPELKKSWNDACPVIAIERDPWEEQYYCFDKGPSDDGGGSGSGAPGDPRPDSVTSGNQPKGKGKTSDESDKGNTFGVDGKSITGSMEQDAKLGYTDGVGTGKKGPNFDALNAATAESLAAAKNTAGLVDDDNDAQGAVANSLANYTSGDVTKAGNFTDQGAQKAQANIQSALDAQAAQVQGAADRILGAPDFVTSVPTAATTSPTFTGMPNQRGITAPTMGIGPRPRANISRSSAFMPNQRAIPTNPMASILQDQINRGIAAKQAQTAENLSNITSGLQNQPTITQDAPAMSPFAPGVTPETLQTAQDRLAGRATPVGIMSTPQATAANVVGTDNMNLVNDPKFGGPAALPTSRPELQGPPEFIETSRTANPRTFDPSAPNVAVDAVSGILDFPGTSRDRTVTDALVASGTTMSPSQFAATSTTAPATSTTATDPLTEQIQAAISASSPSAEKPVGQDPSFFSDAYQDLFGQNARGTALNTVLQAGPLSGVLGELLGLPSPQEQAAMTAGQMFSLARQDLTPEQEAGLMSGKNPMFDAETGTFTDVPIGSKGGTMSTGFLGTPVYSGPNDPDYTGLFQNQVTGNFGGTDGGPEDPPKAPNDPCPPGFQMINGTCTPVNQQEEEDAGTGFQINPVTGLPTLFAPFTQGTPFAGTNPFALQPYTPNQAEYIQQQRSGIQALSPTGAALGKQV